MPVDLKRKAELQKKYKRAAILGPAKKAARDARIRKMATRRCCK